MPHARVQANLLARSVVRLLLTTGTVFESNVVMFLQIQSDIYVVPGNEIVSCDLHNVGHHYVILTLFLSLSDG